MLRGVTPIAVFQRHIECLRAEMPGVRDGRLDSIHDARVATRRIREVLPLTHEWQRRHQADDLRSRFKQMGHSLGRVRDADVRIDLLRYCESRVPLAAAALAAARQREEKRRLRRARKLLKTFERLSVEDELARLVARAPWKRSRVWVSYAGAWRGELCRMLTDRAIAAREAVVHATGVYFPNRAHEARIAIKKLRYAAEIAAQIGYSVADSLIRDFKKTADVLGDQRDRQALVDQFVSEDRNEDSAHQEQLRQIQQVLDAEIKDLHTRYLERRGAVCAAADRIVSDFERPFVHASTLAAAGVFAVAGAEIVRRRWSSECSRPARERASDDETDVSVRVAVPILTRAR